MKLSKSLDGWLSNFERLRCYRRSDPDARRRIEGAQRSPLNDGRGPHLLSPIREEPNAGCRDGPEIKIRTTVEKLEVDEVASSLTALTGYSVKLLSYLVIDSHHRHRLGSSRPTSVKRVPRESARCDSGSSASPISLRPSSNGTAHHDRPRLSSLI